MNDHGQSEVDIKNAKFWSELCGSHLARVLGLKDRSRESLKLFDAAYLAYYPYLRHYVEGKDLRGRKVLEIGLGYGTLGQLIAAEQADYYGIDIASGPVELMRYRLGLVGQNGSSDKIKVGSALELPYPAESFDYVYAIGCLHHTGDLGRAVAEVHRVLKKQGQAVIMVYNRWSFRQILRRAAKNKQSQAEYDSNIAGETAPHTDYLSVREARKLFKKFARVKIDKQNFDEYTCTRFCLGLRRCLALKTAARLAGLDLYITVIK